MYDRLHTREISAYGGVINVMPKFGAFMVLFALANSGLPGTSGFRRRVPGDPGELQGQLLVRAAGRRRSWSLGAAYNLWLVKRVIFGPVANEQVAADAGSEWARIPGAGRAGARGAAARACGRHRCCSMMEASVQHLLQQVCTQQDSGGWMMPVALP